MSFVITVIVILWGAGWASPAMAGDEFEQPPISYSAATPDNAISKLQHALEKREAKLTCDARFGWLPSLLDSLHISTDSQLLVFSKTSLQQHRIAPKTPRALYFNDEVYVGYCHAGQVVELSAVDPQLGTVFYSLDQERSEAPKLMRQTEQCLQCHGTAQTSNLPGHIVRSLFVDRVGFPLLAEGSHRVEHRTPIENRWGGWYVTGTPGTMSHRGNLFVTDAKAPRPWSEASKTLADARELFSPADYPTPHSDLVALMVFEHQTFVQNALTYANFETRRAVHYETEFNRALGEPESNRLDSTTRRIESAGEKLVQALCLADEAPLEGPFVGTSGFAERFATLGAQDKQGRSLRDFDLRTRLFKYPLSYLIYSRSFDELPPRMKEFVVQRLRKVLAGEGGAKYAHLTEADRRAILEILADTKPGLLP
jgi:hypothetical protein